MKITGLLDWLRRLLGGGSGAPGNKHPVISPPQPASSQPAPKSPAATLRSRQEAQAYRERLRQKITALAERFTAGSINRAQFQELYRYYQSEIQILEDLLTADPDATGWKEALSEGQSLLIRVRNKAIVLGFSIYENDSGIPLKSLGEFGLDPALFVPMLSAYRSATEEIFGARLRSTQIEGGRWLCFTPGKRTTTLALFNLEPSGAQLHKLADLQELFENANAHKLALQPVPVDDLACPHEVYVGRPF